MTESLGLRARWQHGEAGIGLWSAFGDAPILALGADAGFDYVTVDLQHGFNTWASLPLTLRTLRTCRATALVRVPSADPAHIMRALDLGADGVVVPMVEDRATAEAIAAACRYPGAGAGGPDGSRSFGPVWADHDGVRDTDAVNRDVICVVQIETMAGYRNVREIVATPGIDVAYIGPYDLALSAGLAMATYRDSPRIEAMIAEIIQAATDAGKIGGMHCDGPEMSAYWAGRGARMLTAGLDTAIVLRAYTDWAERTSQAVHHPTSSLQR